VAPQDARLAAGEGTARRIDADDGVGIDRAELDGRVGHARVDGDGRTARVVVRLPTAAQRRTLRDAARELHHGEEPGDAARTESRRHRAQRYHRAGALAAERQRKQAKRRELAPGEQPFRARGTDTRRAALLARAARDHGAGLDEQVAALFE